MVSLAPLVIVGLVAIFLLHEPLLFLVVLAIVAGFIVFANQYQKSVSGKHYSSGSEDWMSRTGFYVGPFDDTGLPGAANFARQHGRYGHTPQVRLVVTNEGLSFGPAGHAGSPEMVPFNRMEALDLIEGTHPRKLLITPPVAAQRGQVVVTTSEGKIAKFSGIAIGGIQAALKARGASIEVAPG